MEDASSYKLHNILRDKDLRRFTLVLGLYCFDPCSSREMGAGDSSLGESVESSVNLICTLMQLLELTFRHGFTPIYTVLGEYGTGARFRTLPSSTVENVRQIGPIFFKTKPICRRDKTHVSAALTKDYEQKSRFASQPRQTQTKPILGKANVKMGKIYFSPRRMQARRAKGY